MKTDVGCPLGEEKRWHALWSTRLYHRCSGGERLGALKTHCHLSSGYERVSVFTDWPGDKNVEGKEVTLNIDHSDGHRLDCVLHVLSRGRLRRSDDALAC